MDVVNEPEIAIFGTIGSLIEEWRILMSLDNKSDDTRRRRTVRTFAAASFLNDVGADMIYSVWPLFVTTALGANMAALGFIDGLGDTIVSISQAVSGYLSDRLRKRKIFIVIGYLCGSLSRVGYAVSTVWQHLIPMRVLDRAGKIRSAPRDAIVADLSSRENRGSNFGLLRAADNLGATCGILLSIVLLTTLGYRTLFLLAAIPSTIAAVLVAFRVSETARPAGMTTKGLSLRDLSKDYRLFLFLSAIFALGSFSYSFLLINAYDKGFSKGTVPVLYLVFTVAAFVSSIPFGRLSDRLGRKRVLLLAFILWAISCAGFAIYRDSVVIIGMFIIYGLHRGAFDTVQKAFVSELAPEDYRASALGLHQMVTGLCALPASLVAGLLWDEIGTSAPFIVSFGLTMVSTLLLFFVRE
jgi:MFS family permease